MRWCSVPVTNSEVGIRFSKTSRKMNKSLMKKNRILLGLLKELFYSVAEAVTVCSCKQKLSSKPYRI